MTPINFSEALALDNSGNPLPGAKLYFWVSGTTTPLDTYSNFALSSANANPVVADANGRFPAIFTQAKLYKVMLRTSADVDVFDAALDPYTTQPFVYESALPGSAYPGLIVRNTSDGIEYQRNAANDAWVNLGAYDTVANTATVTEIRTGTATNKYGTPDSIAGLWEQGADVAAGGTLTIPVTGGGVFSLTGSSTTISSINSAANGIEAEFLLVNSQTFADGSGIETISGSAMTIAAGATVRFRRIGGTWVMTGVNAGANPFPRGHIWGFTLSNNTGDATNDIDIAAGECRNSTNTENLTLASAITKRLDANWAVGTNQGGLDTGSIANTTYFVYAIKRPDTGVVDCLFSASATSPTLPANYTQFRQLGAIVRSGGAIRPFWQSGDNFWWGVPARDITAANPGTSAVTRTLTLPVGKVVTAVVQGGLKIDATSLNIFALLTPLTMADTTPSATAHNINTETNASTGISYNWSTLEIQTNTSAQIRSRLSASAATYTLGINTLGWVDTRGRFD